MDGLLQLDLQLRDNLGILTLRLFAERNRRNYLHNTMSGASRDSSLCTLDWLLGSAHLVGFLNISGSPGDSMSGREGHQGMLVNVCISGREEHRSGDKFRVIFPVGAMKGFHNSSRSLWAPPDWLRGPFTLGITGKGKTEETTNIMEV